MFKFLHIADVHLDTAFVCRRAEHRDRLREALRISFRRAVECAIEERVHALLIAGDLFDNDRLSFRTERSMVELCRRLDAAGITTIYVSGNHDPGGSRYRAAAISWPDSFHYVGAGEPTSFDVRDAAGGLVGRVIGAGHVSAREAVNLAALFPGADRRTPHVGLLHTMVTGAAGLDGHDRYAPCTVDDLRRTGYDYWALGHIHLRQQVCDRSNAYYPGNLQGRNPRETGPKGGYLVALAEGQAPSVTFRRFAPIVWDDLRLDGIEHVSAFHELVQRVQAELAASEPDPAEDAPDARMLRVTLSGPSLLYDRLVGDGSIQELEEELCEGLAAYGVLDVELLRHGLTRPVDLDPYRNQPHLLGETLALLQEASRDEELLASLLPETLAGFRASDEAARLEYARTLLEGLDHEAGARLLKQGN